MIFPVLVKTFFDISEIKFRIGIEAFFGESFHDFSFRLEAFLGDIHQAVEAGEEILFVFGDIADARQVNGDDTNRAGQGIGAEESATALPELSIIQT